MTITIENTHCDAAADKPRVIKSFLWVNNINWIEENDPQFFGFEQVELASTIGNDVVQGLIADETLAIDIATDRAEFESTNNSIVLTDFFFTKLVSNADAPQNVLSREIITIREASSLRFSLRGFHKVSSMLGGNDNLILRDSPWDDQLPVSTSEFSFLN